MPMSPLLANAGLPAGGFAERFPPMTVAIFVAIFIGSLVADLLQHRDHRPVTVRNAVGWSVFWICLSLGFAGWLRLWHGEDHPEWASLFLTGYVLEKTLSVDNLIVFIAIFRFFHIRSSLQHRILYFGILGAICFRAIFVGIGSSLLVLAGPYAELLFGGFVLWAALQMLRGGDDDGDGEPDYEGMGLVRLFKRFYPVLPKLVDHRFFVNRAQAVQAIKGSSISLEAGITRWMTPAFVCLLVVESSDVMFSFDSVPAVIAVTQEPFIVYTAMIFAILGLRSLYFVVEVLVSRLRHLETAVIGVLAFIGVKMVSGALAHWGLKVPWWSELSTGTQANYSLVVVLLTLSVGVLASRPWRPVQAEEQEPVPDVAGSSE